MTMWHVESLEFSHEMYVAVPLTSCLFDIDTYLRKSWFKCCKNHDHRAIFKKDGIILFTENEERLYHRISETEIEERAQHFAEKLHEFCLIHEDPGMCSMYPSVLSGSEDGDLFAREIGDGQSIDSDMESYSDSDSNIEIIGDEDNVIDWNLLDTNSRDLFVLPVMTYMSERKRNRIIGLGEEALKDAVLKCIKNPNGKDELGLARYIPYIQKPDVQTSFSMNTKVTELIDYELQYHYDEFNPSIVRITHLETADIKSPNKIVPLMQSAQIEHKCIQCGKSATVCSYFQETFWCETCKPVTERLYKVENSPRVGRCDL